jgi:hypothetical protein
MTPTDDERKHLIVELKRFSQSINEDVISQVRNTPKRLLQMTAFERRVLNGILSPFSNRFTSDAEMETRQTGRPRGLVAEYDDPKIRVWAKTWGQIIDDAEGRLTFYKRRLEYKANDVEALRYLRTVKSNYLSDEVKAKTGALDQTDLA